jgi:hypothetical protein
MIGVSSKACTNKVFLVAAGFLRLQLFLAQTLPPIKFSALPLVLTKNHAKGIFI